MPFQGNVKGHGLQKQWFLIIRWFCMQEIRKMKSQLQLHSCLLKNVKGNNLYIFWLCDLLFYIIFILPIQQFSACIFSNRLSLLLSLTYYHPGGSAVLSICLRYMISGLISESCPRIKWQGHTDITIWLERDI